MAINFPNNPGVNDTFTAGGINFTFTGVKWESAAVVEISSDTTPTLGGHLNAGAKNINNVGVITATGFSGSLTGNVTGNADTATVSTNAQGLTGDPSIQVTNATVLGNLDVQGTTTTIDTAVTAVDSLAVDGSITALGNIGIGTTNPSSVLHLLSSGNAATTHQTSNNGSSVSSNYQTPNRTFYTGVDIAGINSSWTVYDGTDGEERLRIDHRGHLMTPYSTTSKVGINFSPTYLSAGPSYNLHVQGDFYAREIQTAYKTRLTGSLIMDGDNDLQNTSLGGVKGIDIRMSGMYRRFSAQPVADWTPNFQHNQSDIDSVTGVGDVFTVTIIVKQRSAGSPNGVTVSGVQVDGTATGVDLDWVGGSAPGASPGSGYDVWTFVVMKTSSTPTYHVLGKRETYS